MVQGSLGKKCESLLKKQLKQKGMGQLFTVVKQLPNAQISMNG
jgi:hypothetical protein